jgi:hypothetical protein
METFEQNEEQAFQRDRAEFEAEIAGESAEDQAKIMAEVDRKRQKILDARAIRKKQLEEELAKAEEYIRKTEDLLSQQTNRTIDDMYKQDEDRNETIKKRKELIKKETDELIEQKKKVRELDEQALGKVKQGNNSCKQTFGADEKDRHDAIEEIKRNHMRDEEREAQGISPATPYGSGKRKRKNKMKGGAQTVWWQYPQNEPLNNLRIDTYRKLLKKDLSKLTKPALIQMSEADGLAIFHNGTYTYKTRDQLMSNIINFKTKTRYTTFAELAPYPNNGFGPPEEEFGNPVIRHMLEGFIDIPDEYKARVKTIVDATLAGEAGPEDEEAEEAPEAEEEAEAEEE